MARTKKVYKDIDFNFQPHPITGDLIRVYDEEAIRQSVKNLILTNFYERPYQQALGSDVRSYMFEPVTVVVEDSLKRDIRDVINSHEPRAKILDIAVNFNEDQNSYDVAIQFEILGLDNPVQINFALSRVR